MQTKYSSDSDWKATHDCIGHDCIVMAGIVTANRGSTTTPKCIAFAGYNFDSLWQIEILCQKQKNVGTEHEVDTFSSYTGHNCINAFDLFAFRIYSHHPDHGFESLRHRLSQLACTYDTPTELITAAHCTIDRLI